MMGKGIEGSCGGEADFLTAAQSAPPSVEMTSLQGCVEKEQARAKTKREVLSFDSAQDDNKRQRKRQKDGGEATAEAQRTLSRFNLG